MVSTLAISLSDSYLLDVSVTDRGVLKYSTVIVGHLFLLAVLPVLPMYFDASVACTH